MSALLLSDTNPNKQPPVRVYGEEGVVKRTFIIQNPRGLHCRPAALLIKTFEDFPCKVTVEGPGASANGRSILQLLSLAAGYETKLTFVLTGRDAKEAMAAVQRVFEDNFAEAYANDSDRDNLQSQS
jgi:phosphocarrier protein HPr